MFLRMGSVAPQLLKIYAKSLVENVFFCYSLELNQDSSSIWAGILRTYPYY